MQNKNISFKNIKIIADLELDLRKSIKKIWNNTEDCYFHFCKAV